MMLMDKKLNYACGLVPSVDAKCGRAHEEANFQALKEHHGGNESAKTFDTLINHRLVGVSAYPFGIVFVRVWDVFSIEVHKNCSSKICSLNYQVII